MTFYIDIILIENMIMNYIILFATGVIVKTNIKHVKIFISALIGSIYAVMSYISQLEVYMNQITKLILSIGMVYMAFMPKNIKNLIKQLIIFYLTSFCFGGTAYYLLYYINPKQINNINGILTGSYPIKIAILGGILGFFILKIAFKIIKNKIDRESIIYNIEIGYEEKSCKVKTILDTGNLLIDPITSYPVVIVEKDVINKIIPDYIVEETINILENNDFEVIPDELKARCRLIPFSSIGKENGMIIGIKPDYIKILNEENQVEIKNVIVGICNQKLSKKGMYSGLIGLELLNYEDRKTGGINEFYSNVKN